MVIPIFPRKRPFLTFSQDPMKISRAKAVVWDPGPPHKSSPPCETRYLALLRIKWRTPNLGIPGTTPKKGFPQRFCEDSGYNFCAFDITLQTRSRFCRKLFQKAGCSGLWGNHAFRAKGTPREHGHGFRTADRSHCAVHNVIIIS